jgi:hypothetical protein
MEILLEEEHEYDTQGRNDQEDFFKTGVYLTEKPDMTYSEANSALSSRPNNFNMRSSVSKAWKKRYTQDASASKALPSIYSKEKERGGGGLIYPRAPYKLLEILRSPKQNISNFNDKLLHNNRVFSHFLDRKNGDPKSNSLNFVPNN